MDKEIILTPEGKKSLEDELAWREGEKGAEIILNLQNARSFGDLSENSEFDDAKDDQAKNAARIAEIRAILAVAKVQENVPEEGRELEVSIGSTVDLVDAAGKTVTFSIVGTTEAKALEHKISTESPAGAALIGKRQGDQIAFTSPSGKVREYTITKVSR